MSVEDTAAASHELTITRIFDAPRDLVFEMWSDSAHMKNWFGPTGMTILDAGTDFRVGGKWFSHLRTESGGEHKMGGVYREIVVLERIVFTHIWEGTDAHSGFETIVTVTLKDLGGKTELVFHQAAFETASASDSHEDGWNKCLDRLAAALAKI
ncbi:MAG: SRPBCC domain-containing protein [Alphaproteobacteria bacterium]|nr:SRPBCC domain-containing protein [Alphaproteobacteria bacterium]